LSSIARFTTLKAAAPSSKAKLISLCDVE
jgi:hypothetical protein